MFPQMTTVPPGNVVCFTNYQTMYFFTLRLSRSMLASNVTLRLAVRLPAALPTT